MKVALDYMFIFDPAETWSMRNEFESSLTGFFKSAGLELEIVQTEDGLAGRPSKRILIVNKVDEMDEKDEKLTVENVKIDKTAVKKKNG